MGCNNERGALFFVNFKKKIRRFRPKLLIQIARRLIGKEEGRLGNERARQRHALLLAARQLRGIMMKPRAKTHPFQKLARAVIGIVLPQKFQNKRRVFKRRHGRNQMKSLKDDSDIPAPKDRARVLREFGKILTQSPHRAAIRDLQACREHQKRAFSRSRRPHNRNRFSRSDAQSHPLQNMNLAPNAGQAEMHIIKLQNRFRHKSSPKTWLFQEPRRFNILYPYLEK